MSEFIALAPLLQKGGEQTVQTVSIAQRYFKERFKKAFGQFDVEKVFWQVVYTEGILVGAKVIYHLYTYVANFLSDPLQAVGEFAHAIDPMNIMFNIGKWIAVNIGVIEGESEEDLRARIEAKRIETLNRLGIPVFVDDLFNKWFGYLLLAGIAIPVLAEYRRYKRIQESL